MAKRLTERIAALQQAQKPTRAGQNRAAFLALRDDIKEALDDGWPVKTVWQTLREEGKISFGYDAFISYVNQLIRTTEKPTVTPVPAPKVPPKPAKPDSRAIATPPPKPEAPTISSGFNFNPTPNKQDLV